MRVVGVIDLRAGRAVHARRGQRDRYEAVAAVGGDGMTLARVYVERFGLDALYVADLDAIDGGPPQRRLVEQIGGVGAALWLDAGISALDAARDAVALGASRVIVGLETLTSFAALRQICDGIGGNRIAFSLDVRHGVPAGAVAGAPVALAGAAADAGATAVILLDLARVGTGAGVDLIVVEQIRAAVRERELIVGGGVRDAADLRRLADAGCDAVLVATALHEGRLTRADVAASQSVSR